MRARALVVLFLFASSVLLLQGAAPAVGYAAGQDAFSFRDVRITESSGVVASSRRDGVWFTHNDSGDSARFFAVDDRGCTLATYDLAGLGIDDTTFKASRDVEDIARGGGYVWLADIGDNNHRRSEIAVYRVDEPHVDSSPHRSSTGCRDASTVAVPAEVYRLAYPDHPHDAETLLADPATGQLLVVTKTPLGQASVYAAPVVLSTETVNVLTLVGAVVFQPSTTYDRDPLAQAAAPSTQIGFDLAGRLMAVGGDVAPARDRVVVRTYTDAFEWVLAPGVDLGRVMTSTVPSRTALRYQRQGEAVAYSRDGRFLLTTCEDAGCTAHRYDP